MARPPRKPLLLFDGDCGFCRAWVRRWQAASEGRADFAPFQEADPEGPTAAVRLVEADRTSSGAEAVFRLLALNPGGGLWLSAYRRLPGFAPASEAAYGLVAGHRVLFSRLTAWLWGPGLEAPSFRIASGLFPRLVALCFLLAFVSLGAQIQGLLGSRGILPAGEFLEAARAQLGGRAYSLLPSLFWLGSGDWALSAACWGGAALAAAALAGLCTGPFLLASWVLFLSLLGVGQEFLSFQWDILLLETGFLAAFLLPWRLKARPLGQDEPSGLARVLLRWLLFRLMLESGAVKLLSGDPAWRGLTALRYHYETQPLPTALAWWAHQLPGWFHTLSAAAVFAIELGAPFLMLGPRRARLAAFAALAFLQLLIAATGSYCFFNLLALSLCLLLLDDRALAPLARGRRGAPAPSRASPARVWTLRAAAALAFSQGGLQVASLALGGAPAPRPVLALFNALQPLRLVNTYGLFAVMTTTRPEISVEGSDDGKTWKEYRFRWKPGDPLKRPRLAAPHQPRLDWQLWFAALGSYRENRWFIQFLGRLLEGSPPVLGLLAENPFPDKPPRFVRALLYEYRFSNREGRRATGVWWTRELKGLYAPVLTSSDRGG